MADDQLSDSDVEVEENVLISIASPLLPSPTSEPEAENQYDDEDEYEFRDDEGQSTSDDTDGQHPSTSRKKRRFSRGSAPSADLPVTVEQNKFLIKRRVELDTGVPGDGFFTHWKQIRGEMLERFPGCDKSQEQLSSRFSYMQTRCRRILARKWKPPPESPYWEYSRLLERTERRCQQRKEAGNHHVNGDDDQDEDEEDSVPSRERTGRGRKHPSDMSVAQNKFLIQRRLAANVGLGDAFTEWKAISQALTDHFPGCTKSAKQLSMSFSKIVGRCRQIYERQWTPNSNAVIWEYYGLLKDSIAEGDTSDRRRDSALRPASGRDDVDESVSSDDGSHDEKEEDNLNDEQDDPGGVFTAEQTAYIIQLRLARDSAVFDSHDAEWEHIRGEVVKRFPDCTKTARQVGERFGSVRRECRRIASRQWRPRAAALTWEYYRLLRDFLINHDGFDARIPKAPRVGRVRSSYRPQSSARPFSDEQTKLIVELRQSRHVASWGIWKELLVEYRKAFPDDVRTARELQLCYHNRKAKKAYSCNVSSAHVAETSRRSSTVQSESSEELPWDGEDENEIEVEMEQPQSTAVEEHHSSPAFELVLDSLTVGDADDDSDEALVLPTGMDLTATDFRFLHECARRSGASVQELLDAITPSVLSDVDADYQLYKRAVNQGGSLRDLGPSCVFDTVDIIAVGSGSH